MRFFAPVLVSLLLPTAMLPAQEPLPFLHRQDVILFQGDSITDGGRQRTGLDYNHIMGQDYAYILAAQIGLDSPRRELNFVNRGAGGDWVSDLAARWQTDTLDLHPALLSILIGVNDTLSTRKPSESAEQFEALYDRLLAQTIQALPSTRIVLGEPFILPVLNREAAAVVVDVRSDKEWTGGHIDGAVHFMLGDLPKKVTELPTDRPLITVCGSGYRSSIAASILAQHGFGNVSSMDGGMTAWNQQNLPHSKELADAATMNADSRDHGNLILVDQESR